MKKLLLILLFFPIISIAQVATVTISIPSNLDLETISKPNNTVSPVYLTARTYLNGGPSNGDNGIPENRFYIMVNGTATGGISGMDAYTLSQQLAKKYIIQRSGFYFTTIKTLIHIDNVLDAQDSIAKWYGLVKGISVKGRIDSVKTALTTYAKSSRTVADSIRLNSEITRAGNKENSLSTRIVNDSTALKSEVNRATSAEALKASLVYANSISSRLSTDSTALKTETARAIASEATKEAIINATSAADYFRGDKSMQNFVNSSRASNTAGAGISYVNGVITNTSPDQAVTIASGNRIQVTGTYPNFTVAFVEPTINNTVTRSITGSTFTVSTTKQARVSYSVSMQCTATIGSAANGKLELQYSTNAGSTWTTVGTFGNSNTVTLAVVLNSVQISTGQLVGEIPAGALVRINPTLSGVNAVATYLTGQEIY